MKSMFFAIGTVCVALTAGGCAHFVRDQFCHPANCGIEIRSIPEPSADYVSDVDELSGIFVGPFVHLRSANGEVHYYAWHGDRYVRYHREFQDGRRVWTFRGD